MKETSTSLRDTANMRNEILTRLDNTYKASDLREIL